MAALGCVFLIPTGRLLTFDQTQTFAGLLAQALLLEHADIATTARALRQRQGKVYVDTLQNGHGKLLVAPYSPRANENAQVSTPLEWDEVGPKLRLEQFTMRTLTKRLQKKRCPLAPILEDTPTCLEPCKNYRGCLRQKKGPQTLRGVRACTSK